MTSQQEGWRLDDWCCWHTPSIPSGELKRIILCLRCQNILNRPSDSLTYFSKAVYPVYIIHMPVQYCISFYLLPLALPVFLKLILLFIGTFGVSLLIYEYFIRRLRWVQPMFGVKIGA